MIRKIINALWVLLAVALIAIVVVFVSISKGWIGYMPPVEELVALGSENPITRAPRRLAAVSKLKRVRVEGSKNRVATTFPCNNRRLGFISNCFAISSM